MTAAATATLPSPNRTETAGLGWQDVLDVPCQLSAEISVAGFSVRDLLLLQVGSVVNSREPARGRIGLQAQGSFIAWGEFDVANLRLGVRITDLG
jgi:flagellar motor switch/type III secretory pathway protein FliN